MLGTRGLGHRKPAHGTEDTGHTEQTLAGHRDVHTGTGAQRTLEEIGARLPNPGRC